MTDKIKKYYDKKKRCPRCFSLNIVDTYIKVLDIPNNKEYIDKVNKTQCNNCNWVGYIDDLKG